MKRLLITVLMVCVAWGAFSQAVDVKKLDLSKAEMHLAGPDAIYVSSIYYGDTRMSVLLKWDGADGAIIYGPYLDAQKLLLDSYELGYAKMKIQGNDTLLISDLILGGQGFSGRFRYDGVYSLKLQSYWNTMAPKTLEMQVAELQTQLDRARSSYGSQLEALEKKGQADVAAKEELEKEVSELEAEIAEQNELIAEGRELIADGTEYIAKLEAQVRAAGGEVTGMAEMAPESDVTVPPIILPKRQVKSGFAGGMSLNGDWNMSGGSLVQNAAGLYFAKYEIPLDQRSSSTVFGFTGKATGAKKIGYGLHFFASGSKSGKGYGYGQSFLVWLTRDEGYYGNDHTYVQLYRSYDDIKMYQVASARIPQSIESDIRTDVLFDRTLNAILVTVNGWLVTGYMVEDGIAVGDSVAFRSLGGTASFKNFYVLVK
jgi:uncharacterized coiled-coil protein SlyX